MRGPLWALVVVLATGLLLRWLAFGAEGSGFATLPILTPASLSYEARMRAEAGQPPGQGGAEALALAEALLAGTSPPDPALAADIEALASDRATLMNLRNRRHALNVRLMDVGVNVALLLEPSQWDAIHMRRDELRARAESAVFGRLLGRLRDERPVSDGTAPPPGSPPMESAP